MREKLLTVFALLVLAAALLTLQNCGSSPTGPSSPSNNPPSDPRSIFPKDNAVYVPKTMTLSWFCTDPDGDTLTFDIYFGTDENPPLLMSNYTGTSYKLNNLQYNAVYFWKVVAKDGRNVREGPVWRFKTGDGIVRFADQNLEAAVRGALSKPTGDITDQDMLQLTNLSAANLFISDLSGLEYALNLQYLTLSRNQIIDITPLANLTNLQNLILDENQITDISPLSNLTNLQVLNLNGNQITYISPLANLTNLQSLYLADNEINDISALVSNNGLGLGDTIDLRYNRLDLTPGSDDMRNINILTQQKGVTVLYDPQK